MAKIEPSDLISFLNEKNKDEYRVLEQKKLISKISEKKIISENKLVFLDLDKYNDPLLKKGVYFALLGSLYAFHDRELDPMDENHFQLFNIIRNDIEIVYKEISLSLIDEETWIFEAFDYGIKHVYYLDWQLYLSKTCY